MLDGDKAFQGSIPETYDSGMVPLIFQPYADAIAAQVARLKPSSVLEIAAGTGVVSRALAPQLAPDALYVVTDLNQAMLDHAMRRQPDDPRIRWQQADAMALPFGDGTFDIVCCQFGAMFFPDRPAAYRETRRVLSPAGQFLFNVWDRLEANQFAALVTETLAAIYPDDPPRFLARTPHGYHDTARIRADLADAGFGTVEIVTRAEEGRAPSAWHVASAYCRGTPLRGEIEAKGGGALDAAIDRATAAIEMRYGSGPVAAPTQAHVITALP